MQVSNTTHYTVSITGVLWSGQRAKRSYTIGYHPTKEQVAQGAMDFQVILKSTVEQVRTVTCVSRRKIEVL